ncbi:flagellar brake protein [Oxalobacteraceae bacterium A2-2]
MNDPIPNEFRRGPPALTDAVEPIAPGSKPHDMTDEHDIGNSFTLLAESGDAVSVYPAGSASVVMARIHSVDPQQPRFVLELNPGDTLPPGEATFVTLLRNAKLQFKLTSEWRHKEGEPTLIPLEFPLKCSVLNRRASARLETPLGIYYMASFVLSGRPYELQLYDFSAGGIGMRAPPRDTAGLNVGRKLHRVRLDLGPDTVMIADLEVRLVRTFRSFLLGEQVQIGCRFSGLSAPMKEELDRLLERLGKKNPR